MNFIIFDLEATCWQGHQEDKVSEIIEIGALRLNGYGEETGEYNRFVKPMLHPRLSAFCMELTSIEQRDVDAAKGFEEVIEEFQDWVGVLDGDDYLLCSWGRYDRRMLQQDCRLHGLEGDWAERHINLKEQFQRIHGLRKPWGLKKTIDKEGFDFDGIHHRAISDAINTAKIFRRYIDEWVY